MNSSLFRIDSLDLSLVQALCATYGKVFKFEISVSNILYVASGFQVFMGRNVDTSYIISISGQCIPGRIYLKTIKVSK